MTQMKQSISRTLAWFIPSPALQKCCPVATGSWQHGSPLIAATAPAHLASLFRDAADSMLAQKERVEFWRRKGAHLVREDTRKMGAHLGACSEGKNPKQREQGSGHSCSKVRKLSGPPVKGTKASSFATAGGRPLLFFTAPTNLETPEKRLVPFPMLQSLTPSASQSQPSQGPYLMPGLGVLGKKKDGGRGDSDRAAKDDA